MNDGCKENVSKYDESKNEERERKKEKCSPNFGTTENKVNVSDYAMLLFSLHECNDVKRIVCNWKCA
jgi:hypothetical protein